MEELKQYILTALGATDEQDLQTKAAELGIKSQADFEQLIKIMKTLKEKGVPADQALSTLQSQSQTAKGGAKLNYITRLQNRCPEGYEVEYHREGGKVITKCKKCGGSAPKKNSGWKPKKKK